MPEASRAVRRRSWRIDVSDSLPLEGTFEIAADVVLPPTGSTEKVEPAALLFCLPGGFLSRKYYDLGAARDPSYSFAEFMAARGFAVVAVDHIGCGESSRPKDLEAGFLLGVDALAAANESARIEIAGRLQSEFGVKRFRSIGVGHSMGSAMTVAQQANFRAHEALVLQSFSTAGLVRFLQGDEADYANSPERAHREIGELARARFGTPYPLGASESDEGTRAAFSAGTAPDVVYKYLQQASTNLLGVPGLLTMIPGAYAPYAELVDVPVFVGVGDHDLGRVDGVPPMLPRSTEVATYTLRDSWHCHNVANTRLELWERIRVWVESKLASELHG